MEIRPATFTQVAKARDGRYIMIEDDVQGVANGLNRIDPHIKLRFSESGEHYVVYWSENPNATDEEDVDGNTTYLIFTAQDLDQRMVKKMEEVYWRNHQPGYSLADEVDKLDAADKKRKESQFTEEHGEMYERLAHAMRKELGYDQSRVFVSKDIAA
ncbi:MAG: hypothetical protein JSS68_15015 [Actinobacteria bacterium]|nr:hypothetical protein [Actinomycetota bacterium]